MAYMLDKILMEQNLHVLIGPNTRKYVEFDEEYCHHKVFICIMLNFKVNGLGYVIINI